MNADGLHAGELSGTAEPRPSGAHRDEIETAEFSRKGRKLFSCNIFRWKYF